MNLIHIRRIAAIMSMTAASFATFSASAETFLNGESFYGQPSRTGTGARVVNLDTTPKYINVEYGETVTFRSQGKEFSWTFDGLDGRAVDIRKVAPAGFAATPLTVYVEPNPLNMN